MGILFEKSLIPGIFAKLFIKYIYFCGGENMIKTSLGTRSVDVDILGILRRGPIEWNQWRQDNRLVSIDLSDAQLSNAKLDGAKLNGVNFYKTDLSNAQLNRADLSNTQLGEANLNSASLNGVNLSGADLSSANLCLAELSGVNLSRADLNRTKLNGADLNQADLRNTSLIQAKLNGADLSNANLSNANLSQAGLSNVNLSDADLTGTNLNQAYLNNVNFSGTQLGIINLIRYNLEGFWKGLNAIPEQGYHNFEIRIFDPQIDPKTLGNLQSTVDVFASHLGYEIVATIQSVDALFLKDIRYKITRQSLTPEIIQAGIECYHNRDSIEYQIDSSGIASIEKIAQATAHVLSAVEDFDNIILLLGQLIVVKYIDNKAESNLITKAISLKLQNQLSSNPTLLSDPSSLISFLDKRTGLINKLNDQKTVLSQAATLW